MADRSEINFSSLDHLNVALSAQKAGVLQSEFRQLVTLVHAPDNLRGLMCLLSNLSKVMPLAIEIARLENDEETIDEILSPTGITTEKLLKLSDVFRSEGYTELFSTKLMSAFDIFKRQFSKSPVYACLGLRPQGNEADRGFDLLQAHLLIFSTRYFGNDLGSHENLFRAMAELCDLKYWKDLARLPDAIMTSDRYYDQLRDCEYERLHVIGTLFDELPKKIRKKKREKPNGKKRKSKTVNRH